MRKGFTLVEIMVVIAVIALVAAVALPNLLRARHNTNETAAIGAMRTLSTAIEAYRSAQSPATYPPDLAALSAANPTYASASLTGAAAPGTARQGYYYAYTFVSANAYQLEGTPAIVGTTGTRRFFVDETGAVRANATGPAGPADPEIS